MRRNSSAFNTVNSFIAVYQIIIIQGIKRLVVVWRQRRQQECVFHAVTISRGCRLALLLALGHIGPVHQRPDKEQQQQQLFPNRGGVNSFSWAKNSLLIW